VEGIFRLSGNAVRVREIKTQFDRGQDVDLSKETDPHVVAGLIKLFLRELPEPLFPFDFYTPLMEAWGTWKKSFKNNTCLKLSRLVVSTDGCNVTKNSSQ
jgi:hypothetical protein